MNGPIWLDWLDKISGHKVHPGGYSHVTVHFLPVNMTSVLQPIDMGIVHPFKCKYRQQIVREKLRAIEYSITIPIIEVLNAINKIKVA